MDRWHDYLFRRHSEEELTTWARRLNLFRFCRAFGGHANDGDRLLLALVYHGQEDQEKLWRELGIPAPSLDVVKIADVSVFVGRSADRVFLSIAGADGDPFEVTAADVERAALLESKLGIISGRRVDPPLDDRHCIAPKYYPSFWQVS